MRSLVPSTLLSWSISRRGTKLLYNWWWDGIRTSSLYYPSSSSSPGWTSCAHNQAQSLTCHNFYKYTVDSCAKSHHQYCVCNAIFDWRTWLKWLNVFFCCCFLLLLYGNFWGAVSGIGLLWEAVSLFLSTCFWNALQSYLLFPLMSCLVLLTITSTQFRGMSWEKLENPHGKLTLIHVVNVY